MEYISPEEAQGMPGLRLALTAGLPAPFGMSARAIFDLKQVSYTPVLQIGGAENEDLLAWTGHRNAPIAVYEDEAPRTGWLDILQLAHRLGAGPNLIPESRSDRVNMIGWTHELIGESGWVWQMRLIMLGLGGEEQAQIAARTNPMYRQYGYSESSKAQAVDKANATLTAFADFALKDKSSSAYLIGNRLSALDIYWVYFSQILKTFPHDICPMPKGLRQAYDLSSQACGLDIPQLIERRDWVLDQHNLPLDF
ncbi:MAG: hypothetical protein AAF541_17950 [Pseudomonadota bacterium]